MTRAAAPRALAAVLALSSALACTTASENDRSLALRAPRYQLQGRDLVVRVEQIGPLAGRQVSFLVVVDGNVVDRVPGTGGTTLLRIDAANFATGQHVVGIKTGSERSTVRMRTVSRPTAIGLAALLSVSLAIAVAAARRRRRSS